MMSLTISEQLHSASNFEFLDVAAALNAWSTDAATSIFIAGQSAQ